ncbi:hypothetical protein C0J52_09812 [Blattella germanica]|nr:hypothetical protein C0J52_09812 [Blattella germanica]
MQEKEQKLLRLYESQTQRAFQRVGRGSAGSSSSSSVSSTSSSLGAGKVRQLFQDRRTTYSNGNNKSGWDRSYPLEPLENNSTTTKQRLQASKSTGNLKVARGTSLERSYSNNNQYQYQAQARRSKSQVRTTNNHRQHHPSQNVVVDLGGSFRQLSHSQQKLYYDDDDDVDYPYHQDEQNNRIFNKHRSSVYDDDIENEDPPFQQLDDDEDDDDDDDVVNHFEASTQSYQKLPNVGGRLLMENKANNNDRYKTYNATTNGVRNNRRMAPAKEPLRRRGEQEVAPAAAAATRPSALRSAPSAKKPELKVSALASTKGPISRNSTSPKTESSTKRSPVQTPSWEKENTYRKTPSEDTEHQMQQRGPPQRGPSARGPPAASQSAPNRPNRDLVSPRTPPQAQARTPAARGKPGVTSKAFAPPSNSDLAECKICGRHFAKDRIPVHENICSKTSQKKRKVFDPTKQRVKGTEAEAYLRKGKPQTVTHLKKTNWRQKHEDFINSIRAAKEMKAHIAKGGKLSDLPPPPPSDYSDYVQCPHCGRRFNQQAAERHIPKCASYEFNKPKAGGAGAGRGRGAVPKKR